jgi:endoglucanase
MAAALAVGSLAFKSSNSTYATSLLNEAKIVYSDAVKYQGSYMDAVGSGVTGFEEMALLYKSFYYYDELAWAAMWLYVASGAESYLNDARTYYTKYQNLRGNDAGWAYSWEEKGPALHVFMSMYDPSLDLKDTYDSNAVKYFYQWTPGPMRTVPLTPQGMSYIFPWGSVRYTSNTAYLAMVYSKFLTKRGTASSSYISDLYSYGKGQFEYIVGKKTGRSLMVGMGSIYPKTLYQKSSYNSYIYFPNRGVSLASATAEFKANTYPQVHIAYGALAGGPLSDNGVPSDYYIPDRGQWRYTEPALDYSAAFVAAAALLSEDNTVTPIDDSQLDLGWNFIPPRP